MFKEAALSFLEGVSVSLRSIIHSYFTKWTIHTNYTSLAFPSPYGVSFILIKRKGINGEIKAVEFPSPYGVSFILISKGSTGHLKLNKK